MDKEQQLITEIRKGNESALEGIYTDNKEKFMRFGCRMSNDHALLEDIYQDAVITFYENVRTGKVHRLTSSIATYIFGIGKYMLYQYFRKAKRQNHGDEMEPEKVDQVFITYMDSVLDDNEEVNMLNKALKKIPDPCNTLLKLFYYEEKSNSEIMEQLGYASPDVVKSQKYRCLQRLKTIYKKMHSYVK